jgi:serine/threonine protein phosphatase PrpC
VRSDCCGRHGRTSQRRTGQPHRCRLCIGIDHALLPRILADICEKANIKVYLGSLESEENRGMGTTLTIAIAFQDQLILAHVGDCRAYLFHDGTILQLTVDHTLVQEMIDAGSLTEAESVKHPRRNVLTRALGAPEYMQADTLTLPLSRGDRIMLCTDGLHGFVSDEAILTVLRKEKVPEKAVSQLIALANEQGGEDNVTVLVINI